jgi:putative transposase
MLTSEMSRHTTFRYCLDPTVEQHEVLARHAGAARFAFNQCLRLVKTAICVRRADPDVEVPWTGFDLINSFNGWKKAEAAGRVITVDADGVADIVVTGLRWRGEVCQQVFEEAAVDLGQGAQSLVGLALG